MLVFGRNVARDLLKNNSPIKKIILQDNFNEKDIIDLIKKRNIKVENKSKREIDNLIDGVHQGIILSIPDYQYNNIESSYGDEIVILLDHIEDPHNFGAIIRTCEAAGIKSIIIPKDRQVQINSTVMKTSVGTLDNMNIISVSNLGYAIDKLKENGFWIYGTSLDNSVDYRDVNYDGKVAIIIGNECSGISSVVSKKCDFLIKIPMYGKTNSLNASVAAGITIYEVIRNRKRS